MQNSCRISILNCILAYLVLSAGCTFGITPREAFFGTTSTPSHSPTPAPSATPSATATTAPPVTALPGDTSPPLTNTPTPTRTRPPAIRRPTPAPTLTDTPTLTATSTPTVTLSPSLTATVTLASPTATPTAAITPSGRFGKVWQQLGGPNSRIGTATAVAVDTGGVEQLFQQGSMIWVDTPAATDFIYVFYFAGTSRIQGNWQRYPDTWKPTDPEESCTLAPPPGLFRPIRGIGRVWCEQEPVRKGLGWATQGEQGYSASYQLFQHGRMLWSQAQGGVIVVYEDGTWESY